ncbi:MAG: hypothetical protein ACLTDM_07245 [Clostridium butyricum]
MVNNISDSKQVGNAMKFILINLSDEKVIESLRNDYGIKISNNMDNLLKIQTLSNWWQEYNTKEFDTLKQYIVSLIAGHRYASYLILLIEGKISIS